VVAKENMEVIDAKGDEIGMNVLAFEARIIGTPAIFPARSRFEGFGLGTFTQNLMNFAVVLQQAVQKRYTDHDPKLMLVSIYQHCDRFELGSRSHDRRCRGPSTSRPSLMR
jgi:hypothetical protein